MQIKFLLLTFTTLSLLFNNSVNAQYEAKTKEFTFDFDSYKRIITKTDNATGKILSKIVTNIPDKSQKEEYYSLANNVSLTLINDEIAIIYDVWNSNAKANTCYVKFLNIETNEFTAPKKLHSTGLETKYHLDQTEYTTFYSPDKSKVAILRDNLNKNYDFKPAFLVFETTNFELISELEMTNEYEGEKRIIDVKSMSLDNEGNIDFSFNTVNITTKVPIKSYSAYAPFKSEDIKNIEEITAESGFNNRNSTQGRFYKSIADLSNDEPISGIRIKNKSHSWDTFTGSSFQVIDDAGNVSKLKAKNLPTELFTYKRSDAEEPFIIRLIDEKPYIVLEAGELMFYSLLAEQGKLFYALGWAGELEYYKTEEIEKLLAKFDLVDAYKNEEPKREFNDTVDGYFNKVVAWNMKFIGLYNQKLSD
jgi:hypothetical protein